MHEDYTRYVVHLVRVQEAARDEALVRAHVAYLKGLEARGLLELAGPFADGGGGMLVLRAGSREEAEELVAEDPFVLTGSSRPEVRAWILSCGENNHLGMG